MSTRPMRLGAYGRALEELRDPKQDRVMYSGTYEVSLVSEAYYDEASEEYVVNGPNERSSPTVGRDLFGFPYVGDRRAIMENKVSVAIGPLSGQWESLPMWALWYVGEGENRSLVWLGTTGLEGPVSPGSLVKFGVGDLRLIVEGGEYLGNDNTYGSYTDPGLRHLLSGTGKSFKDAYVHLYTTPPVSDGTGGVEALRGQSLGSLTSGKVHDVTDISLHKQTLEALDPVNRVKVLDFPNGGGLYASASGDNVVLDGTLFSYGPTSTHYELSFETSSTASMSDMEIYFGHEYVSSFGGDFLEEAKVVLSVKNGKVRTYDGYGNALRGLNEHGVWDTPAGAAILDGDTLRIETQGTMFRVKVDDENSSEPVHDLLSTPDVGTPPGLYLYVFFQKYTPESPIPFEGMKFSFSDNATFRHYLTEGFGANVLSKRIVFPTAEEDWGVLTHFGVTYGDRYGVPSWVGVLPEPIEINKGDRLIALPREGFSLMWGSIDYDGAEFDTTYVKITDPIYKALFALPQEALTHTSGEGNAIVS